MIIIGSMLVYHIVELKYNNEIEQCNNEIIFMTWNYNLSVAPLFSSAMQYLKKYKNQDSSLYT